MALTQYLTFFFNDTTTVDGATVASSAVPTIAQTTCSTDPTHSRPYMMLILEGVDKTVNLAEASVAIGSLSLRLQDNRRLAAQNTGWFTYLLADSGGKAALIGNRVSVKIVDQFGNTKDIDLLVHDITLEDNHTVYKITTRDMRERERTLSLFYRSEEAVIWPIYDANLNYVNGIGSRDGYGRVNPADGTTRQLIPPSKGVRATFGQSSPLGPALAGYAPDPDIPYGIFTFVVSGGSFNPLRGFAGSAYTLSGQEYSDQLTPYQRMAVDPAKLRQYTTVAGSYTTDEFLDGFVLQWRAWGSSGAWTTIRNFPKWMVAANATRPAGAVVTQFITNVTSALDTTNTVTIDKVLFYGIVVTDTVVGSMPTNGQDVEVRLLSGLPPSTKNPIFYEGTFGAFLKACYDGVYSVNNVKIRYNAAVMANLVANSPTLRLIKTSSEKEGLAWLQKNWYKVMRMIPVINSAGEIVPTSYDLPDPSVALTTLDQTNTESASWIHGSGDVVNGVNFTYKRDYITPTKGFASIDVHKDRLDVAGAAQVGESIIEFTPETVRDVTYNILASFGKADVAAEVGFGLAKKASDSLIDRFSLGGQHVDLKGMRTDSTVMAMNEGDWATVSLFWLPDYQSHLRGLYRLMQVVHINDLDPIVRHLELVDAGPYGQALTAPTTLNTSVTLTNGTLTLVESNVPAAQYIRFEIASVPAAAALPGPTDSSWVSVDRIIGPGTVTIMSHLIPPGQTYARIRLEQPGTRPSNWVTFGPFSIFIVADPTNLVLGAGANPSQEIVSWTTGNSAYATRIYTRYTDDTTNADVLQATVTPGTPQTYTLVNLVQYLSYTVTVKHVLIDGAESTGLIGVFIAGGTPAVLATPVKPAPFAGTYIGPISRAIGTFGMAVAAVEFPSYVEFSVATETGYNTGVYGAYVVQPLVPSVRNDWTLFVSTVVSDQLRRQIIARHVRTGATSSGYTTPVTVLPWSVTPLSVYTSLVTLDNFRRSAEVAGVSITYTWVLGPLTVSVWAKASVVSTNTSDPFTAVAAAVASIGTATSITIPWPGPGQMTLLQVEPRDVLLIAGVIRQAVEKSVSDGIPKIVQTTVNGTVVTVLGNSNVQSIRMRDMSTGGTWESWVDCAGAPSSSVDLSLASPTGVAGVGVGVTWPVQIDMYAKPKAYAAGLTSDTQTVTVTNGTSTAPTWMVAKGDPPATNSAIATLTLQASSAPGGSTIRVWEQHDIGSGFSSYANITASLTPPTGAPPTGTPTVYNYTTPYAATIGGAGAAQVTYRFKTEIMNGATILRTTTFYVVWYYT